MRNDYSYEQRTRNEDFFQTGPANWVLPFLAGVGTGAALMYFMDPERGRRRRALLRDQAVGLTNDARDAISATTQDLSNRAYGVYAETRKAVTRSPVSSGAADQAVTDRTDRPTTDLTGQSSTEITTDTTDTTEFGRSATQR